MTQAPLVPGVSPQVYGEGDFRRIAGMVHREAGIVLNAKKKMLAYSRLAPLVRESALATFADYLDMIEHHPSERTRAIASLTTNHTYFYREPVHFEHFGKHVRPELVARAEAGENVRIWSAGCSSGEEIYTLLMVLAGDDRRQGQRLARSGIVALASDLAEHAVAAAAAAHYPAEAVSKLPAQLRDNWSKPLPGDPTRVSISADLVRMVRFRQLNLLRPWPFRGPFDVIFCRNVMIYFDEPTKAALVLNFARALAPGGYLYIGHSERVAGEATTLLEPVGSTIYRRKAS